MSSFLRLVVCCLMVVVCSLASGVATVIYLAHNGEEMQGGPFEVALASLRRSSDDASLAPHGDDSKVEAVPFWPPVVGQRYPDLVLEDSFGKPVRLSDFAGKIILVELAAIPCQGCQAFAGGKRYGGFEGVAVQSGIDSIEDYAQRIAGVDLGSTDEVVFVQVLLYGKQMGQPTREETRRWAQHFHLQDKPNTHVLRGTASLVNADSYERIPGFQLIDRHFILRSDSCGHHPQDNLYTDLLPKLGQFMQLVSSAR